MAETDLIAFRIETVIPETPETMSYILAPDKPFAYKPGQFLTFLFNVKGKQLRRSYSIVSLPGEPVKVTVKRIVNGEISRYISENWVEGKQLIALPPAGRFHLGTFTGRRDIFCFTAGSGITAILPQIKHLLKHEPQSLVQLIYSNTDERGTIFLDEIENLALAFSEQLHVHYFFSDPKIHPDYHRRLNNGILEELVRSAMHANPQNAAFLLCGPFTYMRMVRITLIFMKFRPDQILREIFQSESAVAVQHETANYPAREITINFRGKTYRVAVPAGQTILKAAIKNGIMLPYSCEAGVCSTCAVICKQGKVAMGINEVLTDTDLAGGWVLTCTGHPLTDDVLLYI